jgi:CMP-N-acetylneuraminic acid synthetase
MSKENSVDIDDWIDFQIAEVLIKNRELVVRGKE